MKFSNIGVVAVDLDGTLLTDNKDVPAGFCELLSKGTIDKLILVTGRNINDSHKVTSIISKYIKSFYLIYEDGQFIVEVDSKDNYSLVSTFPYVDCAIISTLRKIDMNYKIIPIVYTTEGIVTAFYRFDKYIISRLVNIIKANNASQYYVGKTSKEINDREIIKVVINEKEDVQNKILSLLDSWNANNDYYYVKNDGRIEIKNACTNKLSALKYLLNYIGESSSNCFYFGNGGNDVDSLKYFDNSFAVENGIDEAKKAAKRIIPSNNNNGVADTLKEIVNKEMR